MGIISLLTRLFKRGPVASPGKPLPRHHPPSFPCAETAQGECGKDESITNPSCGNYWPTFSKAGSPLGDSTGDKNSWETTAFLHRERTLSKIPHSWRLDEKVLQKARSATDITGDILDDLLDANERIITHSDVETLLDKMSAGEWTAESVVTAFCKRAAFAHQLNKNLLELNFEQAIDTARKLDAEFAKTGRLVGPLHGIPITMKDQFHVKDMLTTMGYVGWIDHFEGHREPDPRAKLKYKAESELVRHIQARGGIIIAKTTLVQSLWFGETNNNILGYHWNPRHQKLSSGGSSGGEGTIQAMRGSPVGVGTDIGGSVSMPAAFNGIFSIKPSVGRLSTLDMANSSPGQTIIPTVPGLMSASLASIKYAMKVLLSDEFCSRDPAILPIGWREPDLKRQTDLSFGFLEFDGVVRPHPPITRALHCVKDALISMGHEVIAWEGPPLSRAVDIHAGITGSNGNRDVFEQLALSGEPLIPELEAEFGSGPGRVLRVDELENLVLDLRQYRFEYRQYWKSTASKTRTGRPVDAVILPVVPSAAVIPGKLYHYDYIALANVIDNPTMVIPVTTADSSIDKPDPSYVPKTAKDKLNWEAYDPDVYHGAPASIQLLGHRLHEENLLLIAEVVTEALKRYSEKPTLGKC